MTCSRYSVNNSENQKLQGDPVIGTMPTYLWILSLGDH